MSGIEDGCPASAPPAPPTGIAGVNHEKKQFMLQFFLNARLSDSPLNIHGNNDRWFAVDSVSDLYDRVAAKCRT